MELPSATASVQPSTVISAASELLTFSSFCPACGYPSVGRGLCFYCKPLTQQAS